MKHAISQLIPTQWRDSLLSRFGRRLYSRRSYSQEGEDLVLCRMFEAQAQGIYVDVGAHHPFRFSNTCLLHQRGWRGINIDATPGSMKQFQRFRPSDINLELGVGAKEGELRFFMFREPALNTFDYETARDREVLGWQLLCEQRVQCLPLSQILSQELPRLGADSVDLLTVDVEGLDLDVLRSNDWARFRPRTLVVEILDKDLMGAIDSDVGRYCISVGYRAFAKLNHSMVFLRN